MNINITVAVENYRHQFAEGQDAPLFQSPISPERIRNDKMLIRHDSGQQRNEVRLMSSMELVKLDSPPGRAYAHGILIETRSSHKSLKGDRVWLTESASCHLGEPSHTRTRVGVVNLRTWEFFKVPLNDICWIPKYRKRNHEEGVRDTEELLTISGWSVKNMDDKKRYLLAVVQRFRYRGPIVEVEYLGLQEVWELDTWNYQNLTSLQDGRTRIMELVLCYLAVKAPATMLNIDDGEEQAVSGGGTAPEIGEDTALEIQGLEIEGLEIEGEDTPLETEGEDTVLETEEEDTALESEREDTAQESGREDTTLETGASSIQTVSSASSVTGDIPEGAFLNIGMDFSPFEEYDQDMERRTEDLERKVAVNKSRRWEPLLQPRPVNGVCNLYDRCPTPPHIFFEFNVPSVENQYPAHYHIEDHDCAIGRAHEVHCVFQYKGNGNGKGVVDRNRGCIIPPTRQHCCCKPTSGPWNKQHTAPPFHSAVGPNATISRGRKGEFYVTDEGENYSDLPVMVKALEPFYERDLDEKGWRSFLSYQSRTELAESNTISPGEGWLTGQDCTMGNTTELLPGHGLGVPGLSMPTMPGPSMPSVPRPYVPAPSFPLPLCDPMVTIPGDDTPGSSASRPIIVDDDDDDEADGPNDFGGRNFQQGDNEWDVIEPDVSGDRHFHHEEEAVESDIFGDLLCTTNEVPDQAHQNTGQDMVDIVSSRQQLFMAMCGLEL